MKYVPSIVPLDQNQMRTFLQQELQKIARAFADDGLFNVRYVAPDKPQIGRAYYADGTEWEPVPSGGEGLYEYTSSGWSKL